MTCLKQSPPCALRHVYLSILDRFPTTTTRWTMAAVLLCFSFAATPSPPFFSLCGFFLVLYDACSCSCSVRTTDTPILHTSLDLFPVRLTHSRSYSTRISPLTVVTFKIH
ncbi:hypothetical protein BDR03DRAFT_972593 [Suillus americanus]|nr:hypothetical protein BDR03DRAFT_972593 [Suillus americanus]